MKKIALFTIIAAAAAAFSCEPNTYEEIQQPTADTGTGTGTGTGTTTNITYAKDIQPIITTNCTACHGSGGKSPVLTTYTQVKNATSGGKLLCTIQAQGCKTMPPAGKMPQATINLILLWKTQGYLQ